jgi:hypothetical protein
MIKKHLRSESDKTVPLIVLLPQEELMSLLTFYLETADQQVAAL